MHAIVRCGNGRHYISTVFGYFCNITAADDYQRYLEGIYNQYCLVLDKDKKKLIKQYIYDKKNKYLDPSVLLLESGRDDWEADEEGYGCVRFLLDVNQETIEDILPEELLKKCIASDAEYTYNEFPEIRTQEDIDNLMCVSGCFHDAFIEECHQKEDGSLYVLFDGTWGCKIEIWFSGDVSYSIARREADKHDPYWYGASLLMDDGYIYFTDHEDVSVSDINVNDCRFKAKHMKYHIIPDD